MEKLYTIAEFCKLFGIGKTTYYVWRNTGLVKPIVIGNTNRITETEIQRLIDQKA